MNQKSLIKTSFFDDGLFILEEDIPKNLNSEKQEKKNFWMINSPNLSLFNILIYVSDEFLYEGFLFKKSKKNKCMKKYFYKLFRDRLEKYSVDNLKTPLSYLLLKGVKCDFLDITEDEDFKETTEKFLLILTHNKKFRILYINDKGILFINLIDSFHKWSNNLKKCCILSYFGKYYKNLKVIGKGTFAKVILSRSLLEGKEFAVKTFDKKNLLSEKTTNRTRIGIVNEINLMRQLNHTNIIKLFEVYEGDHHIYLVMELLKGGELFERIINKGYYNEKDASILIRKLLSALEYLHGKGIMHRDIKPENLILKDENSFELKLADFGLAEFLKQKTHLFKRCGTPGYVAPEILTDLPYTTKVDIFSAGVILYILLTGCSPFYGETYNEILIKNKKCEINYDFEQIGITLSEEAIELLKKMLEINPNARYTASQCLAHSFITKFGENFQPFSPNPKKKNKLDIAKSNLQKFKLFHYS